MLDIKFIRENPEVVKENIKKKFQDAKLPLVDQVIELDRQNRDAMTEANNLRASRNSLSKQIGMLMREKKTEEAEKVKGFSRLGFSFSPRHSDAQRYVFLRHPV